MKKNAGMKETDEARADRPVQTFCLLVLTLIASGFALYALKPVLVPFVLAVFFTYCLTPVIDFQTRLLRFPPTVALAVTGLLGMAALVAIAFLVAAAVGAMSDSLPVYQAQFNRLTEDLAQLVPLDRLGIRVDPQTGPIIRVPENASVRFVSAVLAETTALISNGAIVLIFMMFILLGRTGTSKNQDGLLAEIENRVKRYISRTVLMSVLTGVLIAAVLAILRVPFASVFGFLAFLLNFIPNIGSVVATILPLPVVLLSPELSPTAKVLALAIPAAIQVLLGSIIQPKLQGSALNLHPVAVLMSLIFFGMIWGIVGAFLATPIAAVIRIIFERIPATQPLAELLAGRLDAVSVGGNTGKPPAGGARAESGR